MLIFPRQELPHNATCFVIERFSAPLECEGFVEIQTLGQGRGRLRDLCCEGVFPHTYTRGGGGEKTRTHVVRDPFISCSNDKEDHPGRTPIFLRETLWPFWSPHYNYRGTSQLFGGSPKLNRVQHENEPVGA